MRRRTADNGIPGVPEGLPDRFLRPVIELDSGADRANRRLQALQSHRHYSRALSDWIRPNAPEYRPQDVQKALGTTIKDFYGVADNAA